MTVADDGHHTASAEELLRGIVRLTRRGCWDCRLPHRAEDKPIAIAKRRCDPIVCSGCRHQHLRRAHGWGNETGPPIAPARARRSWTAQGGNHRVSQAHLDLPGYAVGRNRRGEGPLLRLCSGRCGERKRLTGKPNKRHHPANEGTGTLALDHLDRLEAEAIHIIREAAAEAERPVMLFSGGKDSCVMLHLARKAFFPARPPFPLLHVDTGWKFAELYRLRDELAAEAGMDADRPPQSRGRGARHQSVRPWRGAAYRAVEDRGAEAGARRRPLRHGLRRRAARRGDEPGQGADLLGPLGQAMAGIRSASGPSCGSSTTAAARRARACASSRSPTGPSATSGPMSRAEKLSVASLYFAAERPTVVARRRLADRRRRALRRLEAARCAASGCARSAAGR